MFLVGLLLLFPSIAWAYPVPDGLVDTMAPRVGVLTPDTVVEDVATTFSAPVSDNEQLDYCMLYVDDDRKGSMTIRGGTASKTYTLYSPGEYELQVQCEDESGNFTFGPITVVQVEQEQQDRPAPSPRQDQEDDEAPRVGALDPRSAVVDTPVTFLVSVADDVGVERCDLWIDGEEVTRMRLRSGTASASHTFAEAGSPKVEVWCEDGAGNRSRGSSRATVTVKDVDGDGTLLKMTCPTVVYVNHPCTTVYFFGPDGLRHAFVNEKVFFSWYDDYNDVEYISADEMNVLPLGDNVTYKPGSRLVKFPSDGRVFTVERGAILRPMVNEMVARHIGGRDWAKTVEDINEVFYRDYVIGGEIYDDDEWDGDRELRNSDSPMINL